MTGMRVRNSWLLLMFDEGQVIDADMRYRPRDHSSEVRMIECPEAIRRAEMLAVGRSEDVLVEVG